MTRHSVRVRWKAPPVGKALWTWEKLHNGSDLRVQDLKKPGSTMRNTSPVKIRLAISAITKMAKVSKMLESNVRIRKISIDGTEISSTSGNGTNYRKCLGIRRRNPEAGRIDRPGEPARLQRRLAAWWRVRGERAGYACRAADSAQRRWPADRWR